MTLLGRKPKLNYQGSFINYGFIDSTLKSIFDKASLIYSYILTINSLLTVYLNN